MAKAEYWCEGKHQKAFNYSFIALQFLALDFLARDLHEGCEPNAHEKYIRIAVRMSHR